MKNDPLYIEFLTLIKVEIEREASHLVDGKCSMFDEYKHKTGIIKGLRASIEVIEESFKKVLKDEE